jgi:hypothetical protein
MDSMRLIHLRSIALAVIATGCGESTTAPQLGEGTFVLRSVAGEPLPARERVDQLGRDYVADTLRFEPRSLALFAEPTIERSIIEREPAGGTVERIEFVAYVRDGDDFDFFYPCGGGPAGDCLVGISGGTLSGDRLEIIAHPNSGLRSPLVYERIQ